MNKTFQFSTHTIKTNTKLIYQNIIPTKISISLMEKGLFIPHFWEKRLPFLVALPTKNGYAYDAIFGNITKNGYIT